MKSKQALILSLLIFVFCLSELLAILHGGYVGQDFVLHFLRATISSERFSSVHPDPPGFYVLAGIARSFFGRSWLPKFAAILAVTNASAIVATYYLLKNLISSQRLLWAAVIVVTFSPLRLIHSTVIASDALVVPIFLFILLVATPLLAAPLAGKHPLKWIALAFMLTVSLEVKYTFAFTCVALLFAAVFVLAAKWREISISSVFVAIGIGFALPLTVLSCHAIQSYRAESVLSHQQWKEPAQPFPFAHLDLLLPKTQDIELLDAPEFECGTPMATSKDYSYPALIHFSTYSDAWNIFQEKKKVRYPSGLGKYYEQSGVRRKVSRLLTPALLILTIPLSLLMWSGALYYLVWSVRSLVNSDFSEERMPLLVLSLASWGLFIPLFAALPYVVHMYENGYWTPRLIMPAIISWQMMAFILMDRCLKKHIRAQSLVLAYSIAVALLSVVILNF